MANLFKLIAFMLVIKMIINGIFYIIKTKSVLANITTLAVLLLVAVATNYTLIGYCIGMFLGVTSGVWVQFCLVGHKKE